MRPKVIAALTLVVLAAGVTLALGGNFLNEDGPLPSYTGAPAIGAKPAEFSCALCHINFDWNNINTPGGSIEILGLPSGYIGGETYRLHPRLTCDSTAAFAGRDWGFQITAVRASDGEGCGTFILDDPDSLRIVYGTDGEHPELGSRSYVEHTAISDRDGLASPVEWTFSWRAPDPPVGTVRFFVAGNASNGSEDPGGDFIFTNEATVVDQTTTARRLSFGALKNRYR
jgi:hypothetical protein